MPYECQNTLAAGISFAVQHFVRERMVSIYRVIGYKAHDAGAGNAEEVVLLGHFPVPG
ncbi:hypothetical protein D3C85_1427860 [compost metagenome]